MKKIKNQSYYRTLEIPTSNERITDRALVINCAGVCAIEHTFISNVVGGRRDFYLLYMYGGRLKARSRDGDVEMSPGMFIIFPPEQDYRYEYDDRCGEPLCYFWAHFTGYDAEKLLEECSLEPCTTYQACAGESIISHFKRIYSEFARRDGCWERVAAANLTELIAALSRSAAGMLYKPEESGRLEKSLSFIHSNFSGQISLGQLAEIEHLSESRYRALFKAITGYSPLSYLTALRISHACELITQTDMTLGEIAERVGYPDRLYFSRLFSKKIGCSPNDYRAGARRV